MAVSTILGTLISPVKVAITDTETSSTILSGLKVIKAMVNSPSEVTTKPMQISGTTDDGSGHQGEADIADDLSQTKVLSPATIEIEGIIEDADTILELIKYHDDVSTMFNVLVKSIYIKGMSIVGAEMLYSGEHVNVTMARISFEQVAPIPFPKETKMSQDADQSSYGFGVQQPTSLSSSVTSLYEEITAKLGF